jgi:hypothetical protein
LYLPGCQFLPTDKVYGLEIANAMSAPFHGKAAGRAEVLFTYIGLRQYEKVTGAVTVGSIP